MPVYEYECTKCAKVIEAYQKFSDAPLKKCEHCAGKLQRIISQSTFHLKGTGWYVTDYADKSSGSSSEPKAEKKSEGKGEKKEAKPASSKKEGGAGDSV